MTPRQTITVIGYSLDAVLEAIRRATMPNNEVTVIATAPLGSPLDKYGDAISNRYAEMLSELLGGTVAFNEYLNPRYMYIPYSSVKIPSRKNGVIQFPLSSKSFDDENEWKECVDAMKAKEIQNVLADLSLPPTKLIGAMKNAMPQKYVDTFIKAMGVTRWRGVQISRISMQGYKYEFPVEFLEKTDYNEYYSKPKKLSYREICRRLLKKFSIKLVQADLEQAKKVITNNKYPGTVVIMDNRVDQLMDYIGGRFERQKIYPVNMKVPPELEFAGDGLFYTPMSTCWAVSIFDGKAKRFMSEPVPTLYDPEISEIPSTKSNIKLYDTYVNLAKQFGNKELLLGQRVETLIK